MMVYKNRLKQLIRKRFHTEVYKPTSEILEKLEITPSRFARIYNNSQDPTFQELFRICEVFDFQPSEMYSLVLPTEEAKRTSSKRKNIQELKSNLLKKYQHV